MDFWWTIPQKGTDFDHLGNGDEPNIGISIFYLIKCGCWGHWGLWGCRGCIGLWGCKGSKVWKIPTDYCRVIQVPEFNYTLMFWKQMFFTRIMKYQVEFWNILNWRLLRPAYVNFFENWWMKLKFPFLLKPPGTIIQQYYWSFYPSEPFSLDQFNMIHPVSF